jgi:hypothetical protein
MTTPDRRPRDDDDTIPPVLFTDKKLKQLIAWSLPSAYNRFGQLVWRQRSGLPAGVPAGVNYANHYFHSFEDAAARPGYNRVYAMQKLLKKATADDEIVELTTAIKETHETYGLHNNDIRYVDTLNVTLASGDAYTAYLGEIYHCDETGLEIEETLTISKAEGCGQWKASKCEFRRLFDKKRNYAQVFTGNVHPFERFHSNGPPATLVSSFGVDTL